MVRIPLVSDADKRRRVGIRWRQHGRAKRVLIALLLLTTGCHAMLPAPEFTAVPTAVSTPYTDALQCLGRLIDVYYGRDQFRLTIAVEPALDKTRGAVSGVRDEIPAEITMMIVTALTGIHRQLLVSKSLLTPSERPIEGPVLPNLTISTAITSYDKAIVSRGKKIDLRLMLPWTWFEGPEADAETYYALSRLTIDMVPFDYPSQVAKPFTHAKVGIKVLRESREVNTAVGVYYLSLGVSANEKKVEGVGLALRTMAEWAVLQMLGRRFRLPYTRCLDTPIQDTVLDQRIMDYFESQSTPEQAKSIRELIRGYGERVPMQGPWDAMIDARLEQLKQRYNLQWSQGDRSRTYLSLYSHLPLTRLAK